MISFHGHKCIFFVKIVLKKFKVWRNFWVKPLSDKCSLRDNAMLIGISDPGDPWKPIVRLKRMSKSSNPDIFQYIQFGFFFKYHKLFQNINESIWSINQRCTPFLSISFLFSRILYFLPFLIFWKYLGIIKFLKNCLSFESVTEIRYDVLGIVFKIGINSSTETDPITRLVLLFLRNSGEIANLIAPYPFNYRKSEINYFLTKLAENLWYLVVVNTKQNF